MAVPRKISTNNRKHAIDKVEGILLRQDKKLGEIIDDLKKEHVDDKRSAKKLLTLAQRLRKKLPPC